MKRRIYTTVFLLVGCILVSWCPCSNPGFSDAITESKALVENLTRQYPGISVSVAVDGKIVWSDVAGFADIQKQQPVRKESLFRLYSLSKSITGLLVARLEDEGVLDLQKEIGYYVTSLPDHLKTNKVYQLLSHTSGIRHYKKGEWLKLSRNHCTETSQATESFLNDKLDFKTGTKYQYSSFGYVLLSRVIESAAKRPYTELVAEKITHAAGVDLYFDQQQNTGSLVSFYEPKKDLFKEARIVDNSCKFGGGGWNGSAEAVTTIFMEASNGGKIIPPQTWKRALKKLTLANNDSIPYSYGLQRITSSEGWDVAVHTGSGLGGSSAVCIAPEYGVVVTVLANLDNDDFYKNGIAIMKNFVRAKIAKK